MQIDNIDKNLHKAEWSPLLELCEQGGLSAVDKDKKGNYFSLAWAKNIPFSLSQSTSLLTPRSAHQTNFKRKNAALKGRVSQRDIWKLVDTEAHAGLPSLVLRELLLHLSDHSRGAKEWHSRARYLIFMSHQITKLIKILCMELFIIQLYGYMTR